MARLDLSVIIIGKICSGKSSLAKDMSNWLKLPIASFGAYLTDYSKANNLLIQRESLQTLGEQFINENHSSFLHNVIGHKNANAEKLIFEGVRHAVILNEIKALSQRTFSIFLDAKEDIRLARFIKREKEIDTNNAKEDFYLRSKHPVEREVDSLREGCNMIISTNESYHDFLRDIGIIK